MSSRHQSLLVGIDAVAGVELRRTTTVTKRKESPIISRRLDTYTRLRQRYVDITGASVWCTSRALGDLVIMDGIMQLEGVAQWPRPMDYDAGV